MPKKPPSSDEANAENRPAGPVGGRWQGAAAGLVGAATLTVASALVHTVAPAVQFIPVAIAQTAVRLSSGSVDSFFIDRLGHLAARLALIGTSVGFALTGAILGLLGPAIERRLGARRLVGWAGLFLPLWVLWVAMYPTKEPQFLGRWAFAAASLPLAVLGGLAAGWAWQRLIAAPGRREASDLSRRYFLRALGWGGAGVAIGVLDLSRFLYRRPDPGQKRLSLVGVKPAATPPPAPAFEDVAGLTSEVTSNDKFYVVNEDLIYPDIDPATWRLAVGGLVDRELAIPYSALRRLPAVERYQTLECISNKVGGHLMSTAKWVGIPLREILQQAGAQTKDAVEVVFRSSGGYSDNLSVDQAMDETTLIAIGMNDHVLPRAHGFPARLLSVGTYGMKNPKWLDSIEVVDKPYQGFWEQRGWFKPAIVKTESRIDVPTNGTNVGSGPVTIAGVAIGGDRGISRVEVTTDAGNTWHTARLEKPLSKFTWVRWLYVWTPPRKGRFILGVRAFDGLGQPQTPRDAAPFPSGASGYDGIEVFS